MSIIVLGKNDTLGLISPKYIFMLLIAVKKHKFSFILYPKNKVFFSQTYTLHINLFFCKTIFTNFILLIFTYFKEIWR